jgi:chromosome segregation ATPase
MPDLVFVIKTTADLAAAESTLTQLKELKRQAVATGVSTGDLDKQIVEVERATKKFSAAQEGAGKGAAGHEEKIHGLNKAMGMLARSGGEAGRVLNHLWQLAGSPVTLGIALASIGIDAVIERFKKMREEVEETKQKLLELNRANFDSFVGAVSRAADAQAEYNRVVGEAGQDKDQIKTIFDQRLEFLEAEIKAIGENIKAQEELAIARYKAANAGQDTAAGEADIRAGFAKQRGELGRAGGNARVGLMEEERARRDDAGPLIDYNDAKNRLKEFDIRTATNDAQNRLNQLKADAPKLDKKAADANSPENTALIQRNRDIVKQLTAEHGANTPEVARAKYNLETLEIQKRSANLSVEENARQQAAYTRTIDDAKAKLADLTAEVAKAKSAYEGNNARVKELDQRIETARGVQRIENTAADKRAVDARFAPLLDAGISQSETTAGKISRREKVAPQESDQLRTLGSMIAGQDVNVDTAAKMFMAAGNNKQIEENFLARLMAAVERLARGSGPAAAQLESRLRALESQVQNQGGRIQGAYNQ